MQVYSGEVIGLIGENGAGKSTLMKLISGVEKPSMGEMFRMGKPYSASSILDANHQGIGMVFQEQSLVGNLTIAQNIYLGREKGYSKCGFVNWNKMNQDAKKDVYKRQELDAEAGQAPAGAEGLLFIPYLAGERTPFMDPYAKGIYFGMGMKHEQAHIIRATMEGVIFNLKECALVLDEMGIQRTKMIASGGAAKGVTWKQIQADILEMPV